MPPTKNLVAPIKSINLAPLPLKRRIKIAPPQYKPPFWGWVDKKKLPLTSTRTAVFFLIFFYKNLSTDLEAKRRTITWGNGDRRQNIIKFWRNRFVVKILGYAPH